MSTGQQQKAQARAEREARERAQARTDRRRQQLLQLGAVLGIAAIIVVVLVLVSQDSTDKPNASSGAAVVGASESRAMLSGIPQSGSMLGDPKAPVVLTEFADLQCPFCRDYALNVLPQVIERYVRTGKLRLDLRLQRFIGPDSNVAARAAQAAATRDRMWNFVDVFYRNQGRENSGFVTDAFLSQIATAAGVPAKLVRADNTTGAALENALQRATSDAQEAGLTSTPSFLIGPQGEQRKVLAVQRLDVSSFEAAIDAQLKR